MITPTLQDYNRIPVGDYSDTTIIRPNPDHTETIVPPGNPGGIGDSSSSTSRPGANAQADFNLISKLITDSDLYKRAYELFSSDTQYGRQFLDMLISVPQSYVIRDENWWDSLMESLGGTSGYQSLLTDSLSAAFDEIRSLIQNYYSYKNSLPIEQVSQLQEAGINAAITGQGVESSQLPTDNNIAASPLSSSESYTNKGLSEGISSFVDFLSSLGSLVSVGFSAYDVIERLKLDKQAAYNAQEIHDMLLASQGVTTDSPYRVLSPDNSPVISDIATKASEDAYISARQSEATANALRSDVSVPVAKDGDTPSYEMMSGVDVLNSVSKFRLGYDFAESAISYLRSAYDSRYAQALAQLNNENLIADAQKGISESEFFENYFNARDGVSEGLAETDLANALADLRQYEATIKEFESYLIDMKFNQMKIWADNIEKRPTLAPYLYKAMFDFNMSDTFWHQTGAHQYTYYGLQVADNLMGLAGSFFGFGSKVPKVRKTRSVTTHANGKTSTTDTESYLE